MQSFRDLSGFRKICTIWYCKFLSNVEILFIHDTARRHLTVVCRLEFLHQQKTNARSKIVTVIWPKGDSLRNPALLIFSNSRGRLFNEKFAFQHIGANAILKFANGHDLPTSIKANISMLLKDTTS